MLENIIVYSFCRRCKCILLRSNVKALNQTLNNELIKVSKWLQVKKLTLNIKKTQVILFNAKNKKIKEPLKLKINGENIKQVNSTKFLGIIIDPKLTWK